MKERERSAQKCRRREDDARSGQDRLGVLPRARHELLWRRLAPPAISPPKAEGGIGYLSRLREEGVPAPVPHVVARRWGEREHLRDEQKGKGYGGKSRNQRGGAGCLAGRRSWQWPVRRNNAQGGAQQKREGSAEKKICP
ncbi:hypothetical protein MRX96_012778 [Rhipicephalus microplus]